MRKKALIAALLTAAMTVSALAPMSVNAADDDVLSVSVVQEIKTLLPWAASEEQAFLVLNQAQEGLLRMDADNNPQPALAESYEVSDDKLTYTFHLRDGLQWSDGTPLTADDFVFAWLKQMSSEETNGYSFIMTDYIVNAAEYNEGTADASEVGVTAVDDQTLEVELMSPTPYFTNLCTMCMFFPVNEDFFNEQGTDYALSADNMIYCGPYVITDYDPAVGVTFEKNESYWDAENVQIENAQIHVMKDSAAAFNAYQAGELSQVTLDSSNVEANKDSEEFSQEVNFRTNYIQFNLEDEVMGNANMRKAISYAIDRDSLVDYILADGSVAAEGFVATGMHGNDEATFRELNGPVDSFDLDTAQEYYDAALEELGEVGQLSLLVADDSTAQAVATFVQSELTTNLGLDVAIDTKTMQGRGDLMDANNYQFAITAWGADYDDAMTYLDLYTSEAGSYRGNYRSDEYDELIYDAKAQTDDEVRLQDLLDAEKMLVEEDMVISPIYYRGSATLTKSNLKDLITHPIGVPMEFKFAYFED